MLPAEAAAAWTDKRDKLPLESALPKVEGLLHLLSGPRVYERRNARVSIE